MAFHTNLNETPVAPGIYTAEVVGTRDITTKSGYPMVWVDWRIEAGPHSGSLVSQGIAFVPQMVNRNNHLLKAMGQPYGKDLDVESSDWHGLRCQIVVGLNGDKPEVGDLNPLPAGTVAPTVDPEPVEGIADSDVPF